MLATVPFARRWWYFGLVIGLSLTALLLWLIQPSPPATDPPAPADGWFTDITQQAGLDFIHDPGPIDARFFMPQIVGSGVALLDCDGDDRLDIYLVNNGGPKGRPNALYRQQPDGTFIDASRGSGLDVAGYGMGVAIGDLNNDGKTDVILTEYGGLRLFLGLGDGRFAAANDSGLSSTLWGTSVSLFDYDRDGWLDVIVANYVEYDPAWPCMNAAGERDYCHPMVFPGAVAKLFRNRTGDRGAVRFEDVTIATGLARLPSSGLGVVCADFNGDGWPDIFAANDGRANHLWINQRDGTFKEDALASGVAFDGVGRSLANMGVALGDTHGEGRFDLFVTHLTEETNTLWRQGPRGHFVDRTSASNLTRGKWRGTGFGTVFADFDQDGRLDLAIANGRVARDPNAKASNANHWDAYGERNQLFTGSGPGQFRDISPANPALSGSPNVARGLAVGDLDGDGAPDLLITTVGGPARLLRNVVPQRGHGIIVRAIDPLHQRDAIGAEVTIEANGKRWVGWVNPGQSYLSSIDPRVHFGLGEQATIDRIRIRWPDGTDAVEQFPGGPADRVLILRKGQGKTVSIPGQ